MDLGPAYVEHVASLRVHGLPVAVQKMSQRAVQLHRAMNSCAWWIPWRLLALLHCIGTRSCAGAHPSTTAHVCHVNGLLQRQLVLLNSQPALRCYFGRCNPLLGCLVAAWSGQSEPLERVLQQRSSCGGQYHCNMY